MSHIYADDLIARRVAMGHEVESVLEEIEAVYVVIITRDFHPRCLGSGEGGQLRYIDRGFILYAVPNHAHQPWRSRTSDYRRKIGVGQLDLGRYAMAHYGYVFLGSFAELVKVIGGVPISSSRRIFRPPLLEPDIKERTAIRHPGSDAKSRAIDSFGKVFAGVDVDDVHDAVFGAAGRNAVADVLSVPRGLVEVERVVRRCPCGAKAFGVHQDSIRTSLGVADIEFGQVLARQGLEVEVSASVGLQGVNHGAGVVVLLDFRQQLGATQNALQDFAGVRILRLQPLRQFGRVHILHPAVVVGDL